MSDIRVHTSENQRVATGRTMKDGSFLQFYPEKKSFTNEEAWRGLYSLPGNTFLTYSPEVISEDIVKSHPLLLQKMKKMRMPLTPKNIIWFWRRKEAERLRRKNNLAERKKARLIEAEKQKFFTTYGVNFHSSARMAWSWSSWRYKPTAVADYKRINDLIYPPAAAAPVPAPVPAPPPVATSWTAEDEQRFLELQARRPTTQ